MVVSQEVEREHILRALSESLTKTRPFTLRPWNRRLMLLAQALAINPMSILWTEPLCKGLLSVLM